MEGEKKEKGRGEQKDHGGAAGSSHGGGGKVSLGARPTGGLSEERWGVSSIDFLFT